MEAMRPSFTYTSVSPEFVRYRPNRKADDLDFFQNSEVMEQIETSPCSTPMEALRSYDPLDPFTYTSVSPEFVRYRPNRKANDLDFFQNSEGTEKIQTSPCSTPMEALPSYDPLDPFTYKSVSPEFVRYRPNRKADDENFFQNSEGMEQIQTLSGSKIMFLISVAALFVFFVCESGWPHSKLYGVLNVQLLNEYADGFSLGDILKENYLLINENEDMEESGLKINKIDLAYGRKLALKSTIHMEAVNLIVIPMLYAVTGVFFYAATVVITWYKRRAIHDSLKTSLKSVKGITSVSPVPTSDKKKDNMWNDSGVGENSVYISNPAVRRKLNYQEKMITIEKHMESTSSGSLTTMAKKVFE